MSLKKEVIVIGAGFSGLSTATHLAQKGYQVRVVEKHGQPGGRARTFLASGFLFDRGPSWYWMPDVFERYFNTFGKTTSDYYQLKRLSPSYRVFWENSPATDVPSDINQLKALFESIEAGSANQLEKFLKSAEYKYQVGINDMVLKPGLSLTEYLDKRFLYGILTTHLLTPFSKYIRKHFKHPQLHQLLEFPILFLGARPADIPALYSLMNYADMVLGTWYPMGGMGEIVNGMYQLALEKGVVFNFNEEVYRIDAQGKQITNVHTSKGDYQPLGLIASADYHHVDQNLLQPQFRSYSADYWKSRTMAPSCLLYYVGVSRKIKGLLHHNLFFDADFGQHAHQIYTNPSWPDKPLFYVCAPSVTDPSVAPAGCENLFILIPVAPGITDTPAIRQQYFDVVMQRIEAQLGESFREQIIYRSDYAGSDFTADYNSFRGNAYGLANTLMQTGPLKPRVASKKIKNLYYAGQLTAPGPGVPPALLSGQVVANEFHKKIQQ